NQPWFLNTVVEARTNLASQPLLELCLRIERANDRIRLEEKSARTLDLDMVFYGNRIITEPSLIVPHPRFAERKFVLVPLSEIAPNFIDPLSNRTVTSILQDCADSSVVRPL